MSNSIRVLFVDDEVAGSDLLVLLFRHVFEQSPGLEAYSAPNGRDALELLKSHGPFDLVITDYLMPQCDGCCLIQAVRSGGTEDGPSPTPRSVPIILITMGTDHDCFREATARLFKPFLARELIDLVRAVIER